MKAEDQIDLFNEIIMHLFFIICFFVVFYGLIRAHHIVGIRFESRFFRAEMQWYITPLMLVITLTFICTWITEQIIFFFQGEEMW
ncbi:hypothetical protein F4806DRAFT_43633 [Annulohypoxylon nitens]|nr:hypothetical protein F4806DRAFT_43633 [Annulohypoxylon nitens]